MKLYHEKVLVCKVPYLKYINRSFLYDLIDFFRVLVEITVILYPVLCREFLSTTSPVGDIRWVVGLVK